MSMSIEPALRSARGESTRETSANVEAVGESIESRVKGLDWNEIAGAIEDAYCEVAPKSLVERARADR